MSVTIECYEKVSRLMDELENLTGWENDFVMSVADYEEGGKFFSREQAIKIEEIYEQYCN